MLGLKARAVWIGAISLVAASCSSAPPGEDGDASGPSESGTASLTMLTTEMTSSEPEPTTGDVTTGCETKCATHASLDQVVAGAHCTCILWDDHTFRCWGSAEDQCTGWGAQNIFNIGDDETPASVGDVPASFTLADLSLGFHSCVVTSNGDVRCWGDDSEGQLGRGKSADLMYPGGASDAVDVSLGASAQAVVVGDRFSCALTKQHSVRCWGTNDAGQLGYGHTMNIGDDEPPGVAGDISLGDVVVQLVAGDGHACALLASGEVRCWGRGSFEGLQAGGMLGYGNLDNIGDDELPSSVEPVVLPGPAARLDAGGSHTCAVLRDGQFICWGVNTYGQLGLGHTKPIGDDETPTPAGLVVLASPVVDLALYANGTCVLLDTGKVHCWGSGLAGSHGLGNVETMGDNELAADLPALDLGEEEIVQIAAGGAHVCARARTETLWCWGANHSGQLGLGNTMNIGDDESPFSAGPVPYE